jgi:hypothetical protein
MPERIGKMVQKQDKTVQNCAGICRNLQKVED